MLNSLWLQVDHQKAGSESESKPKPSTLPLSKVQGNACKRGLPQPRSRSERMFIHPGRSHQWLTLHRSSSRSNADCRPLLQQSSPNRGQVVQPGKTRKGITSRLTMDAGLIDTPLAPL